MSATILRVGLTGNIAAGKSTAAGWLRELGCHVLDLDAIGHRCLEAGTATHRKVVLTFGEAILTANGDIDRRALGTIVFSDDAARRRLEEVLHPAIREREQERIDEILAAAESAIVVSEAALLYETGAAERYHRMVVVVAPDELRRQRLEAKGLSEIDVSRRMAAQMNQERKAELADYVIDNGGTLEATHASVRVLGERLQQDLERHAAGEPLDRAAPLS